VTGFRAVATVVIVASVVAAVWVGRLQFASADDSALPIAPVRTGEFVAVIRTRGQIEAQKSVPVYAPLAQDLRIAWMSPISEPVERGEPMLRFDPSVAERDLIERRGTLERAQASRNQAIGDAKVAERQDERDLVDARLGVEVAELAIVDSEFVPRLEARPAASTCAWRGRTCASSRPRSRNGRSRASRTSPRSSARSRTRRPGSTSSSNGSSGWNCARR
jgi:multidrug efflux pump subunit AcrA (membrane-fusion protein)